jgi:diguanylate cyclase (GGDEF)-like protein
MTAHRFPDPRPDARTTTLLGLLTPPVTAGLALTAHPLPAVGACALTLVVVVRLWRRLRAALTDPVTGLPTRVGAERYLTLASGAHLTLAITDVKDLRGYNTSHGHAAGDQALACFAAALWRTRVPGDLIARLGGDEFLIITRRSSGVLARDLGEALRRPVVIGGQPTQLRASTGVCPIAGGDARAALAAADAALRQAKTHQDTTTITHPGH